MSFSAVDKSGQKCTLEDQLGLHRTHVQLFAGKHYLHFIERLSTQFVRFPDETFHILLVGMTVTEKTMIEDFLKCRDINIHTISAESTSSAHVLALKDQYKGCKNVHLEDAKTLEADGGWSMASWADQHRVRAFQLVSINLASADTMALVQQFQLNNDSNIEKFGAILYRLDGTGTLRTTSSSSSSASTPVAAGGLLVPTKNSSSSSSISSSASVNTSTSTSTSGSNDMYLYHVAKHLVSHGYELFLPKCHFGGGALQIDADFFAPAGSEFVWRTGGGVGGLSVTSVLAVHVMYGPQTVRSTVKQVPCQSLKQSLVAVNSASCPAKGVFTCDHKGGHGSGHHGHHGKKKHGGEEGVGGPVPAAGAGAAVGVAGA
jgi:hypothetical protein